MNGRGIDWPVRRSTRAFVGEARRVPGYGLGDLLHGYVYGRWPYFYIRAATRPATLPWAFRLLSAWGARLVGRQARKADPQTRKKHLADTYHGKVVTTQNAEQLVTLNVEIDLRNLEQVIPYAAARDIVLRSPDHIVALECPCRAAQDDPCTPLDVCLVVGEPFASFVADHHPARARRVTQKEAVDILRAEHERGHVHHAFFKDAVLGRFYAICNCCRCCCGAMKAWANGVPMLASSGHVAVLDAGLCQACAACVPRCPFGALTMSADGVRVNPQTCMGCGVCVSHCPTGALSLVRAPERGQPLEIHELMTR